MRSQNLLRIARNSCIAVLGAAAVTTFSSCGDSEEPAATETPAQNEQTAAPAADAGAARDALLNDMIYSIGKLAGERAATDPAMTEPVRNMLALTEAYYAAMAPAAEGKPERARLSLRIAEITRDLTAYAKAQAAYATAQADFDAMPEAERTTRDARRMQSAIHYGMATSLLSDRKATDALAYYEKALAVDLELFGEVAPADGEKLPDGNIDAELARSAADVMGDYRCLGECQYWANDPEEARDTYNKGIALAKQLDKLSPEMSLEYIKLSSSLGDLESRVGNRKEALTSWLQAANFCRRLFSSSARPGIRLATRNYFERLRPNIIRLAKELEDTEAAQVENQKIEETPAPAAGGEPTPVPAGESAK